MPIWLWEYLHGLSKEQTEEFWAWLDENDSATQQMAEALNIVVDSDGNWEWGGK